MIFILDFILKYWLQVIFAAMLSLLSLGYRRVARKIKEINCLGDGIQSLLYDRLRQGYKLYMKEGYITIDDFNCMNNIYENYHKLGGNGTGTKMIDELKELPNY